jgi:pimeloyl-ACP methyl ester carboxylesterase
MTAVLRGAGIAFAFVTVAASCAANGGGPGNDGGGEGDAADGGSIEWSSCGASAECAELEVPVDYTAPDGDTLTLSIARVPARGDRIGPLFVNPGGPGANASDFAVGIASGLPDEVTEHFDIVGVDPRGLGASAIDCGVEVAQLYSADPSIDSTRDEAELIELSREYVDGCEATAGDLLPHLGTENVARDIDAVRAAMGDEQLSYLGYSYGTAIGQTIADIAPDRVRAMVLDGVLELGVDGIELAREQALGFERTLDAVIADCNRDDSCPIGPDAGDAVARLMSLVEQQPIAAASRPLGPGELALGMVRPLYSQQRWPDLAEAIDEALDGDGGAMVSLANEYLSLADFDVFFAVSCLDSSWPDTSEQLLAAGADAARDAPHFGQPIVNDYVRCALWPVESDPLPEVTAPDAPPIVVVSTTGDPATPYEAGVRTAERLATGVLLTHRGEGHGVVGTGVSCVDDAVATYLVDLEPPDDGTVC